MSELVRERKGQKGIPVGGNRLYKDTESKQARRLKEISASFVRESLGQVGWERQAGASLGEVLKVGLSLLRSASGRPPQGGGRCTLPGGTPPRGTRPPGLHAGGPRSAPTSERSISRRAPRSQRSPGEASDCCPGKWP